MTAIPLRRRLIYSAAVFALFLGLLEGALALISPLSGWLRQGQIQDIASADRLVLALGDSVTYGHGLPRENAWPAQLQLWFDQHGLSNGRGGGLRVLNRGLGGQKVGTLRRREIPFLEALPAQSAPVVLLMIGHNDLLSWSGMGGKMGPPSPGVRPGWSPRLFRVLRWMVGIADQELPQAAISAKDSALFTAEIAQIQQAVQKLDGTLLLLTYALPGRPEPGADAQAAKVLVIAREHQLAINDVIRQSAARLDLPLLDLERGLGFPETWDPNLFRDYIHLTEEGSRRVAVAVGEGLLVTGRLGAGDDERK